MEKVVYRKVRPQDAAEYVDFHNYVWRCAYKDIFPEEVFLEKESRRQQKIDDFCKKINDEREINWVATYKEKIVGLMGGYISSPVDNFNEYADLAYIYIDPDFQNKGVGTRLKNIFIKWAKKHGANQFVIGVLEKNTNAWKVYEKWGGQLDKFTQNVDRLATPYKEVFYTFKI